MAPCRTFMPSQCQNIERRVGEYCEECGQVREVFPLLSAPVQLLKVLGHSVHLKSTTTPRTEAFAEAVPGLTSLLVLQVLSRQNSSRSSSPLCASDSTLINL